MSVRHRLGAALPKALLVLGLAAVVAMAFRVSWNALRDVARAVGADHTAAVLYPMVVDGLMALALVSTLVLTGRDRTVALRVLGTYVAASLVLNYDHGLVAAIQSGGRVRLADWAPANWALMFLATSLPVGSIYFGSDLVAKVLHHSPTDEVSQRLSADKSMDDQQVPAVEANQPPPAEAPTPIEPLAVGNPTEQTPGGTRSVPSLARTTTRPQRSVDDLVKRARSETVDWPIDSLTGERLRKTFRTSSQNGRMLRDLLRGERAQVPVPSSPDNAVRPLADLHSVHALSEDVPLPAAPY